MTALFRALRVDPACDAERFFDHGVVVPARQAGTPPSDHLSGPDHALSHLTVPAAAGKLRGKSPDNKNNNSSNNKSRFSVSTLGSVDGHDRGRASEWSDGTGGGDGAAPHEPYYYLLSHRRKWLVVGLVAYAGATCGMALGIYYPALGVLSGAVAGVGVDQINLSITTFLAAQGIVPVLWAPVVDRLGRRPIYIASLLVYTAANVELAFAPRLTFTLLLALRALQAVGTAAVVSLGNCVVSDIASPEERIAFLGFYQAVQNVAVLSAPVVGGILLSRFDVRFISMFLLVGSSTSLVLLGLLLPETCRRVAGYGSSRQSSMLRPPAHFLVEKRRQGGHDRWRDTVHPAAFLAPFKALRKVELGLDVVFSGLVFGVWNTVISTTTRLLGGNFPPGSAALGVMFVPNAVGALVGALLISRLMAFDLAAALRKHAQAGPFTLHENNTTTPLPADFPYESLRLRHLPWLLAVFVAAVVSYGWALSSPASLAAGLAVQGVVGLSGGALLAQAQALASDLAAPGSVGSVSALANLVRCAMAAAAVGVVDMLISWVGPALAFSCVGLLVVVGIPTIAVSWAYGDRWRLARAEEKWFR